MLPPEVTSHANYQHQIPCRKTNLECPHHHGTRSVFSCMVRLSPPHQSLVSPSSLPTQPWCSKHTGPADHTHSGTLHGHTGAHVYRPDCVPGSAEPESQAPGCHINASGGVDSFSKASFSRDFITTGYTLVSHRSRKKVFDDRQTMSHPLVLIS